MRYHDPRFSVLVTWVAGVAALTVAISLPAGYFYMARSNLAASIRTTAEMQAETVERIITSTPDAWIYQQHRLEELLTRHSGQHHEELAVIVDRDNDTVAQAGQDQRPPQLAHSVELFDSGVYVGSIRIVRSLRETLDRTGIVALFSFALAAVVFIVFRSFPLRALHRISGALALEKERAEVTLHSIGDAVIRTDASGKIEYVNPVAERLTGSRAEEFLGRSLSDALPMIDQATQEPVENPLIKALAERRTVLATGNKAFVRRDGLTVAIDDSAAPIIASDGEVCGGVLVFHDVTAAREMSNQLSWKASHDDLTGLPNRSAFENRLDAAVSEFRAGGPSHAMFYLDLDKFKNVNDTCGHAAGDELLRQMANLMGASVRASDMLARLGGDEFGVLLLACPLEQAQRIAADLLNAIQTFRFAWKDKQFEIGASIGIVEIIGAMRDGGHVFRSADAACYTAKELGRGRIHVYRAEDSETIIRHKEKGWTYRIARAMEEKRFMLYYQPYLSLSARAGAGIRMELLLRMIDEEGRMVLPGTFIPAAERHNLIQGIDEWVIATAFARYASLVNHFGEDLVISINLSGTSLNGDRILDFIREQTAFHHLSPGMICFEINEFAAINNLRSVSTFMKGLKLGGFRFALDDFSAGMSSFSYLKNLPADYLKINGSLVKDIATDAVSRAMVSAISEIGHAMGLKTVALYAHSQAVIDELRGVGVDYAQGYAVAAPHALPVSSQSVS